MKEIVKELITLCGFILTYFVCTINVFYYVHNVSTNIIDEAFHLPLGLRYCHLQFHVWDNKVTTLPGLYIMSSLLTAPFNACTVFALRLTVYFMSLVNLLLVYYTCKHWSPTANRPVLLLNTLNIALTPPVFFFSMIYYTDILSMTLVNATILFGVKGHTFPSSICGYLAMLTRQNNAVYVLFIAGYQIIGRCHNIINGRADSVDVKISNRDLKNMKRSLQSFRARGFAAHNYSYLMVEGASYALALLAMAHFIVLNGGIVVGDKEAHSATIHIPQLFYFTLFTLFFAWPHVLQHLLSFVVFVQRNIVSCSILLVLILATISFNTIVHPYLLSDNRHYLFYVWKLFLVTANLRQIYCPIYLFGLYCIGRYVYRRSDMRFALLFPPTLMLILCSQALIDIRYFITPYVILRAYMGPTSKLDLLVEFAFHCIVSIGTLYVFGTKEVFWIDFVEVQRIIW